MSLITSLLGSGGDVTTNAANTFTIGPQTLQTGAAGNIGLIVSGAASQTADLVRFQDNTGAVLSRVTASGGLTLGEAVDVAVGTTTGTKIGTSVTQKLGFFNATPVVQQSTTAVAPAGGTGTAAGGWDTAANRDIAIATINALRTTLRNLGFMA